MGQAKYPRGNIQLLARMLEDFLLLESLGTGEVHKHLGMLKIGPTWIYSCPVRCHLCHSSGKADVLGNILRLYSAQCTLASELILVILLMNIHPNWPFIVTVFCKCQYI